MEKTEPQELRLGLWKASWRKGDASRPGLCRISEAVCSWLTTAAEAAWPWGTQPLSQARRSHSQFGEDKTAGPELPHPVPWRSPRMGPLQAVPARAGFESESPGGLMSALQTRVL